MMIIDESKWSPTKHKMLIGNIYVSCKSSNGIEMLYTHKKIIKLIYNSKYIVMPT